MNYSLKIKNQIRDSPTLNFSPDNLKGEKWKDIPDFDGLYELSDYGRVKSIGRWIDCGSYDYYRPGKIIKPRLTRNRGAKKDSGSEIRLQVKLHKDKKRYFFSVARLVYNLFVSSFNLEDHTVIVSRKNGNSLDCFYQNLVLKSISEVAREGFKTGKRKSLFQLEAKPVTQYSPEGQIIKTFKIAKAASASTGVPSGYINDAARSKDRMAGGYYWRYGAALPVIKIQKQKKQRNITENTGPSHPPYLNRNLQNLPGEIWKSIDQFEGLYEISSCGRIKSLRRIKAVTTQKNNKTKFWTREFIMKQTAVWETTKYKGSKSLIYLIVRIKKGKTYKSFSVARLVYDHFSTNKDTGAKMKLIHKDGDKFNTCIDNLEACTQSEALVRLYRDGRRKSHFSGLSKKVRAKYASLAAIANRKPVTQYSPDGKRIAIFESSVAAAAATGVYDSALSNALNGRYLTAGGFIWRKGRGRARLS